MFCFLTIWVLGFPTTFEPFDVQIPHWQAFQSLAGLLKSEKSPHQRQVELSWRLTDVAAAWLPELNGENRSKLFSDAPFYSRPPSFSFWEVGLATRRVLSALALPHEGYIFPAPAPPWGWHWQPFCDCVTHSWRRVQHGNKSLTVCSFFSMRLWGE